MMDAFSIKTTVPCDFGNLSYLLMVCHLWLPLIGVPLSYLLLPSHRLSKDLLSAAMKEEKKEAVPEESRPVANSYGSTDC